MANARSIAVEAASVTPSDTASLDAAAWIYVGGGGNIAVKTLGGSEVTFVGVIAGTTLPVMVEQVKSTSTTATNLIACW